MKEAAVKIASLGAQAVLVKGGHLEDGLNRCALLERANFSNIVLLASIQRIRMERDAPIPPASLLSLRRGMTLVDAVEIAKRYITKAIETNPGLGKGSGPVNHHAQTP